MKRIDIGRYENLDFIRGFALLGILVMNIVSFALPISAYQNPLAYGDFSGTNKVVWIVSHLFFEEKFFALFSILFGVGITLFSERLESRGKSSLVLHYRRMGWLLIFGLLHAWFFWYGDILVTYAIVGMVVYAMRNLPLKVILSSAITFLSVPLAISLLAALSLPYWPAEQVGEAKSYWSPTMKFINEEINQSTGSYVEQLLWRKDTVLLFHTQILMTDWFWRAAGFMLLGIFLFRTGLFAHEQQESPYRALMYKGLIIGLTLTLIGMYFLFRYNFSFERVMFLHSQWNYVGSIFVALGYLGVLLTLHNTAVLMGLKQRLQKLGRVAFSGYIMQTFICVLIFNYLGYFGQLERWQLISVVLAIWLLQLFIASFYLRYFNQGPLEYLWRKLTYKF